MENGMLNCKERQPYHMNCFKTCLRFRRMMGEAVDSICQLLMGLTVPFSIAQLTLKLHTKCYQICNKYPLSTEYGMLNCKERHPLVMNCSKSFLRCIKLMVSMRFLMVHLSATDGSHWAIFPPRVTFNMHTKCQILSTLSVQKMGC